MENANKKVKKQSIIQKIIWQILMLTPFSFIYRGAILPEKLRKEGVEVENLFGKYRDKPLILVKKEVTLRQRLTWLVMGLIFLGESYFIFSSERLRDSDIAGSYAFLSIIYGFILVVIALFPKIDLNRKIW